jgi:hypothetical protein
MGAAGTVAGEAGAATGETEAAAGETEPAATAAGAFTGDAGARASAGLGTFKTKSSVSAARESISRELRVDMTLVRYHTLPGDGLSRRAFVIVPW